MAFAYVCHVTGDRHVPMSSALSCDMAQMHDMRLASLCLDYAHASWRIFKAAEGMLRVQNSHTFYFQ